MKLFSVIGLSKSGKTTTIENIVGELRRRGHSVGSVKEIHYEGFAIDKEGTNTFRHMKAGSEPVTALGCNETDILYKKKLDIPEILKFYKTDYVVMEGVRDCNCPVIICAASPEDIEKNRGQECFNRTFLISGVISNETRDYRGIPVMSSTGDIKKMVDFIEQKVYRMLPDFPPECCSECGYSCRELGARILKGLSKFDDCVLSKAKVSLHVDGRKIGMVPFVQDILKDSIRAIVKNLKGCREAGKIEITIDEDR
jgi:molybdopterin-guanine dinucleotide biosynthesis adapter protein